MIIKQEGHVTDCDKQLMGDSLPFWKDIETIRKDSLRAGCW